MLDTFSRIFVLLFTSAITQNIVLNRFLGICPFLGVTKKLSAAVEMGIAVTFVTFFSTLITWLLYRFVLVTYHLEFLDTLSFILVIAALVQLLEMYLHKFYLDIYNTFGIYLPLITTNCIVLGVALLNIKGQNDIFSTIVYPLGTGIGFLLSLILMASIREKLDYADIPKAFKGTPIALVVAAMLALAFTGLSSILITN